MLGWIWGWMALLVERKNALLVSCIVGKGHCVVVAVAIRPPEVFTEMSSQGPDGF